MKKKIIILTSALLAVLLAVLIIVLSVQTMGKYEKKITKSVNSLTSVQTVFEVTVKEEKVFIYSEMVEIVDGKFICR